MKDFEMIFDKNESGKEFILRRFDAYKHASLSINII